MNIDPSKIQIKSTKVYYLRMEHRPAQKQFAKAEVSFALLSKPTPVEDYLELYGGVGLKWNWLDRLVIPQEELYKKINEPNTHIYVMKVDGHKAGFVELVIEHDFVELLYFGLMPAFIGKGYGKYFLDWTIQEAWSYSPKWLQLNTCDLDHEYALSNYRKLGFIDYTSSFEDRKYLI